MCDTCGCNVTDGNRHLLQEGGELARTSGDRDAVEVLEGLLSANDHQAAHNRDHFAAHGVLAINLMSSPGSGKTSLLEATIEALGSELKIGVIEGDLETENDAKRIREKGAPAIQIATGSACHLDAHMVHHALHDFSLDGLDILFVENVGNLVCPASFDLGQHFNVALLSVTEGDDKPAKYPVMFRSTDLVLLTKSDLLAVLDDFEPERATEAVRNLANQAPIFTLSARKGQGMDAWLDWLRDEVARHKTALAAEQTTPINPDQVHDHVHGHHHHHHHP